jgi:hypothetical protein
LLTLMESGKVKPSCIQGDFHWEKLVFWAAKLTEYFGIVQVSHFI